MSPTTFFSLAHLIDGAMAGPKEYHRRPLLNLPLAPQAVRLLRVSALLMRCGDGMRSLRGLIRSSLGFPSFNHPSSIHGSLFDLGLLHGLGL